MSKTESAIQWMENHANNNAYGYDQRYRWGEKGDFDCSSAVISAWQAAGVPVMTKGATYTGNMYSVFLSCGFEDVTGTVNLVTGAGLRRGDVLLNTAHHTAMYCGNGKEVEASINERGTAVDGAPGDLRMRRCGARHRGAVSHAGLPGNGCDQRSGGWHCVRSCRDWRQPDLQAAHQDRCVRGGDPRISAVPSVNGTLLALRALLLGGPFLF